MRKLLLGFAATAFMFNSGTEQSQEGGSPQAEHNTNNEENNEDLDLDLDREESTDQPLAETEQAPAAETTDAPSAETDANVQG